MRARTGVAAVGAVALLAVLAPGAAHATEPVATPAVLPADVIFYPEGQEPPPKPAETSAEPSTDPAVADPATAGQAPEDLSGLGQREREAAHARGSRAANDLVGWRESLYQGKWFVPRKEDKRRCILDRESNFNYRATSGVYHGAYQMSEALARGATWMMQPEVRREMGEEGVAIVEALRKLTPNRWNRYWQDRAFWTVWRHGEGASHWRGDHC